MIKKLCLLTCLCLLITGIVNAQDAGLVAHWKLDDGSGDIAMDSAGTYDGELLNGPVWTYGIVDGALRFDGANDCIEIGSYPELNNPEGSFSVTLWANIAGWSGEWVNSMLGVRSDGEGWCLRRFGGWWATQHPDTYTMPSTVLCFTTRGIGHADDGVEDSPSFSVPPLNEWIHIACVYDSDNNLKYIYFNGTEDAVWETNVGTISQAPQRFYLGARSNSGDTNAEAFFNGSLDDVRFYNRTLTAAEVTTLATPPTTNQAREPIPEDGAEMVSSILLQWTPADIAETQNVYLGASPDLGANDLVSEEQTGSSYNNTAGWMPDTTYYWRVDSIRADGTIAQPGDVWSFTTGPATAFNPDPEDGYRWVRTDAVLSWTAGVGSVSNDIYFGTNQTDVAEGIGDSYKGNQAEASFEPGMLENDTPYYWRVDAVDAEGTTHTGDVWRFKTAPVISPDDPSLVGWWKLDEGQGMTALDWSGNGHNGTLAGDPQWVAGIDGGALELDGFGDYVDCGNSEALTIQDSLTMAVWFKTPGFTRDWEAVIAKGDGAYRLSRSATNGNALHMGVNGTTANYFDGNKTVTDDEWHHGAGVYDTAAGRAILYIDGIPDVSAPCTGQIEATDDPFYIGENAGAGSRYFGGLIDDVRIYNRALSQDELSQIINGDPTKAGDPVPISGTVTDIEKITPLSWTAGDNATQHDVYFGIDEFNVHIADSSDTTGIYRGRQGGAGYNPPEGVEWGRSYYWRIDEAGSDGSVSRGNVWTFTITDYLIVEDFEDYNDYPPDEVWNTWIDGFGDPANGSTSGYAEPDFNIGEHYLETNTFNSGSQSLPLFYDNAAGLSEVTRTLTDMRDWTLHGVNTLSLWYHGNEDNAAEQMYVALNGNAVVVNDDVNAALATKWIRWDVPLQAFADQGVNLSSVSSISIGFGNKANPVAGGQGHVFFDDIRLYILE